MDTENTKLLSANINVQFLLEMPPVYSGTLTKVYRAQDINLRRTVGIKEVDLQKLSKKERDTISSEICVWIDYAAISAKLPQILAAFESKGKEYIVMQWIEGKTLRKHIEEGGITLKQAINYMIQLCDALAPIHQKRRQHKDLKPENIQITKEDTLYLLDFNISAAIPHTGVGTDGYLAPECCGLSKQNGTSRVDVYAIGVILYELLTGISPAFGVDFVCDPEDNKWQFFKLPSEYVPGLPQQLDEIVEKCMALQAGDRYENASAVGRKLRNIKILDIRRGEKHGS